MSGGKRVKTEGVRKFISINEHFIEIYMCCRYSLKTWSLYLIFQERNLGL